MHTSSLCAALLLPVALAFGTASAAPLSQSATTAIQQMEHPSGMRDAVEKKYGPKWCQKHPRKCAKSGVTPTP